jgi:signal transduction histidine kinase
VFSAAAGTIVSSQSEAVCYENIALACLELWGEDATTYIGRIDPNVSGIQIVAVEGKWKNETAQERQRERQLVPPGHGLFAYTLTTNAPVVSFSIADDNRFIYHSLRENSEYLGAAIAMPLCGIDSDPIAVISVEHDLQNYFDTDDLRYLRGIATLGVATLTVHKEAAVRVSRDIDGLFIQLFHDVAEPLQAIIADADVLRYEASLEPTSSDEEMAKRLENISVRATNIVDSSLRLSQQARKQIDAGIDGASSHVATGRVNLFRLLSLLVDTWSERAAIQGIEIRSLFNSLRGIEVQCDETELSSALGHLIGNAIKYSFWGRRPSPQSGDSRYGRYVSIAGRIVMGNALIEIQNYGIGILQSELTKVKEKFYRGHLAMKEGRAGTGRGLWSADVFFTSLGGRVDVSSVPKASDPTRDGNFLTTVTAVLPHVALGEASHGSSPLD